MATFPPSVTNPSTPSSEGAGPSSSQQGGGSSAVKLAMLGQLIQGLATQYPQAQQGIKMMMDGLRQIQSSVASQSTPSTPATPPV